MRCSCARQSTSVNTHSASFGLKCVDILTNKSSLASLWFCISNELPRFENALGQPCEFYIRSRHRVNWDCIYKPVGKHDKEPPSVDTGTEKHWHNLWRYLGTVSHLKARIIYSTIKPGHHRSSSSVQLPCQWPPRPRYMWRFLGFFTYSMLVSALIKTVIISWLFVAVSAQQRFGMVIIGNILLIQQRR